MDFRAKSASTEFEIRWYMPKCENLILKNNTRKGKKREKIDKKMAHFLLLALGGLLSLQEGAVLSIKSLVFGVNPSTPEVISVAYL